MATMILILLVLIQSSHGFTLEDDVAALKELMKTWRSGLALNWSGNDPCLLQWQGISCLNGSIAVLDLNGKGIKGVLPAAIGKLKNLKALSLQKNELTGALPDDIGSLSLLTTLKLAANKFSGSLPSGIGSLSNLQVLALNQNQFTGSLPDLSNLTQLTDIFLQNNNFNGSIPPEIGNFKSLRTLHLSFNNFSGPVPTTISQLSQLATLYIDHNMFSGSFPNISGLRSLQYLWLQNNELTGPIPLDIGSLTSLQNLGLENNDFTGSIPLSLVQLSSLPYLFLQNNNMSGTVPDLSGLINLQGLSFQNNSFKLIEVPTWVSSMQNLQLLFLDNCSLTGTFPSFVFSLPLLTTGKFDNNMFNGTLDISKVGKNLTLLSLENNRIQDLVGNVPYKFQLLLGGNPVCDNTSFPHPDLCEMAKGGGPRSWHVRTTCTTPVNCSVDQVVNPTTCNCTFSLTAIVKLSSPPFNSITGARIGVLERQLSTSTRLTIDQVRVVNATFEGTKSEITVTILFLPPYNGKWRRSKLEFIEEQLNKQSVISDNGVYSLVLITWPKGMIKRSFWNTRTYLSLIFPIFFVVLTCVVVIYLWRKHLAKRRSLIYGVQQELARNSRQPLFFQYSDLKLATRDFNASNKLGEGGFGEVFKGVLPNGFEVAVKRLYPTRIQQGTQEFVNEVTIITGVMHRNLVKLIGCCVQETERILVYEYVENNSLHHALFDSEVLTWKERVEIAIGTARGIAYLHEECETRIIHRDIKASNILLDKNLNSKIADFGLARLFPEGASHVSTRIAGTFGYVAPEYGLYGQLTEKADTYSFGVVLLEIMSGRKSIEFTQEVVLLLDWAWQVYEQGNILDLVDKRLQGDYNEGEFRRFVQVALLCTQAAVNQRPKMSHVVAMLLGEREVDSPCTPGIFSEIVGKLHSQSNEYVIIS